MWSFALPVLASEVRLDLQAPWLPEERQAAGWISDDQCSPGQSIVPGLWQLCTGREVEGGLLLGLTAVEAAAGVAVLLSTPPQGGVFDSGRTTLLVAASEPMIYSAFDALLASQRARRLPYVPLESGAEIWSAPFRPQVVLRPPVLLGTLALASGAVALDAATRDVPTPTFDRPNLLGAHPPAALGYPAIALLNGGLMLQVATAEEIAFRGHLQSALVRGTGEGGGLVLGSLIFGASHATNALMLEPEQRRPYLLYSLPYITLTGTWLSWVYHQSDYKLSSSVAGHFWYNVLVSTAGAVLDPEHHLFSLQLGGKL
jgi:membrane protease YdiL (CAAX protease family)